MLAEPHGTYAARGTRSLILCLLCVQACFFLRAESGGNETPPKSQVAQETLAALKKNFTFAPAGNMRAGENTTYLADSIFLLPKVTVRAAAMPKLDANDLYTDKGLSDSFLKHFPGASLPGQPAAEGSLQIPNYAATMHRDEVRLRNLKDLTDLTETLKRVDQTKEAKKLEKEIDETFVRNLTDRDKAMDRSANGGRAGN